MHALAHTVHALAAVCVHSLLTVCVCTAVCALPCVCCRVCTPVCALLCVLRRFVEGSELAELDMKHPRVPKLWRCGQDYLMCGQVISAASGIVCALRMRGPLASLRFVCRSVRLLVGSLVFGSS